MEWIEWCQQNGFSLIWEGVASLVTEAHRNGDSNVMLMVVDLVKGLKGGEVRRNLLMIITWRMFHIRSWCKWFTHASKIVVKHHKAMYYHGHKFCIKKLDDTKKTCDSGITAIFEVTNISSRNDIHPQQYQNQYYGILDDIIECEFNTFKVILFIVKWHRLRLNQNDPDRMVIQHDNRFTMINTGPFEPIGVELYVLPS